MNGKGWMALAVVLMTAVPASVVASHLVAGNPETVVTGHTVLASNFMLVRDRPTDFAAIAGLAFVQRRSECVVWTNGLVVFDGTFGDRPANDNGRDPCGEIADRFLVVAVEAGDCDPREASSATFVRDLSFDDPNGARHLVAEVRYACRAVMEDAAGTPIPFGAKLGVMTVTPQHEYAWVTEPHVPVVDPTLRDDTCLAQVEQTQPGPLGQDPLDGVGPEPVDLFDDATSVEQTVCAYNFALIVDTCNDEPASGDDARGAEHRCTDGGGKEFPEGNPHRGPRFDDTARRVVVHDAEPSNQDDIRDGNSNTWPTSDPDNHREDKTADPCYPPETGVPDCGEVGETDYDAEEDHLAAEVDLFVSLEGCLGVDEDGDGVDDGARTLLGVAFCGARNDGLLTAMVVNHPGCVKGHDAGSHSNTGDANPGDGFPEDQLPAFPTGNCWDLPRPPDDAPGAG